MFRPLSPIFLSLNVGGIGVYDRLRGRTRPSPAVLPHVLRSVCDHVSLDTPLLGINLYGDCCQSELDDLFDACRVAGVQVGIDITSSHDTVPRLDRVLDRLDLVRVSLYSLDKERNDAWWCDNPHASVLRVTEWLAGKTVGKVLLVPVDEHNVHELPALADFALSHGFSFNPLFVPGLLAGAGNSAYDSTIACIVELHSHHQDAVYIDFPCAYRDFGKSARCVALWLAADIDWDGSVRGCKFSRRSVGTIGDLVRVWQSHSGEETWPAACMHCDDKAACGGGCLVLREEVGHDPFCPRRSRTS